MISKKYNHKKDTRSKDNKDKITTWQCLKEEILNSPSWLGDLDIYDLNDFEGEDNNIIVFEALTDDTTENRFCNLCDNIKQDFHSVDLLKHIELKLLLYVQFPLSAPIMMSEMIYVNELVDSTSFNDDDYDIKLGLSPRKDNISRIVLAISSDNL